ncbi:MAG: hypothetical protein EOO16_22270 [Chitinophagaceae bacterium]|nr:MAG: hypothetical protein EOO16_22270 [Chitinophagaceae bacterium]
MEKEQLNDLAVLAKVMGHFDAHKPTWENIPPISESVQELVSASKELRLSAVVQADGTPGDTNGKNMALELSASLAYKMGRRIFAWASKNGKTAVAEAVDFSETDLDHGAEDVLITRYEVVLKYAKEYPTELAAYKVNDAATEQLERAISTFKTLRSGRDDKSGHRIYSTAHIDTLIKKVRDIYEVLDAEVEGLIEDPEFVETYFIARRKTDRKATRSTPEAEAPAAGS